MVRRTNFGQPNFGLRWVSMLGTLKPSEGSTKSFKRLGRGPSSGKGKTSGRGQKGQKARGKVKPWFEGGQTPIYKLFPKVGFTNVHSKTYNELNLERIQSFYEKGLLRSEEILDMRTMKKVGLVTGTVKDGVKILGKGAFNYKVPLKIEASGASQKAIEAIERAGGSFVAKYFNALGLRAHLHPEWFLRKRGRVPLQARPTKRKVIDYYSNPDKRGYLVVDKNVTFLETIKTWQSEKSSRNGMLAKSKGRKSALEAELEVIGEKHPVLSKSTVQGWKSLRAE